MQRTTYIELRKTLIDKGALSPVNLYGALTVLAEMSFLALGAALLLRVEPFGPAYWVLEVLMAISIFRASSLMHECVHESMFTSSLLNTVVGTLFSPFCLIPYLPYRDVHMQHHKWLGIVDKDPTQRGLLRVRTISRAMSVAFGVVWRLWLPFPFMNYILNTYWVHPARSFRSSSRSLGWKGIGSALFALSPHVAAIAVFGLARYAIFYGPMFFLFYIQLENMYVPQHSRLFAHMSESHPQPIPPYQQDAITRSTKLSWLAGLLHGYFHNLHTEHHLFPKAPWYRLPLVQRELARVADKHYNEVDFLEFMRESRSKDPTKLYAKALPK